MGHDLDPAPGTALARTLGGPVKERYPKGWVVFVRYFVELPLSFDVAEDALLRAPAQWVPTLADQAAAYGEALLVEAGADRGARARERIAVSFGPVIRHPLRTILGMAWRPAGARALSPALDADIEIGALGAARAQLSISARYRPALAIVGRVSDRAVLHRVAEATVKNFLDRVGQEIEWLSGAGHSAEPATAGERR